MKTPSLSINLTPTRTPFRAILFVALGLSSAINPLNAIELTTVNQKKFEGDLKFIRQGNLSLKSSNGRTLRVNYDALDSTSKATINSIIRKRGGTIDSYSWMKGDPKSFQQSWPKTVRGVARPTVKRMTKQWKPDHYVYESQNYEFITNAKLTSSLVLKCATLFEASFTVNSKLPLNLPGAHRAKERKFRIYIHETRADYRRAGGPAQSGGVYFPATETIHVPLVSLGVGRQGSSYKEVGDIDYRTLSHEITHQMMEGVTKSSWFIEGSAEYVSTTPYTYPATFQLGTSIRPYHKSITEVLGKRVKFPKLKKFMNLPYPQFIRGGVENYSRALMLTYFFYLMDDDGAPIKDYLKVLQTGAPETTAQPHLLNGRSYEQIEALFTKAWKQHGILVTFTDEL